MDKEEADELEDNDDSESMDDASSVSSYISQTKPDFQNQHQPPTLPQTI